MGLNYGGLAPEEDAVRRRNSRNRSGGSSRSRSGGSSGHKSRHHSQKESGRNKSGEHNKNKTTSSAGVSPSNEYDKISLLQPTRSLTSLDTNNQYDSVTNT